MSEEYDELYWKLTSPLNVGELGILAADDLIRAARMSDPNVVVEIGFNRGSSALAFLLSNDHCKVYSVDIRAPESVSASVDFLQSRFPDRFTYVHGDSAFLHKLLDGVSPDFIFIDGDHSYDGVKRDAELSIQMAPKFLLFDDYLHEYHGPDVRRVISELGLTVVEIFTCTTGLCLVKL